MINTFKNDLINKVLNMSRFNKQLLVMFVDAFSVLLVLFITFSIRFGSFDFPWYFPLDTFILLLLVAPVIAISLLKLSGIYNSIIRYVGFEILWAISKVGALYAITWGVFCFLSGMVGIPRSVIFINWVLFVLLLGSTRLLARWFLFRKNRNIDNEKFIAIKKNVLIYGAGVAGIQLMSVLKHSSEYKTVGFIDDSLDLQGSYISGMKIFSMDSIEILLKKLKVDEVLIALPSTSRARRLNIINIFESFKVIVRTLPSFSDLAGGKVSINDLHKVSIKDLLGRESTEANNRLLSQNIKNKVVLVTGAGGSIGSELCRQIIFLEPKVLVLYEVSEHALYNIEKELIDKISNKIDIFPILGNAKNKNRLINVFKHFNVNTIYHAAAYKHVPMVEFNTTEGVDNNIFGTLNCAEAAISSNVETFVLISTDKAVRPTNIMGATKRCAELILQSLALTQTVTIFTMVRFGNVLDSSGSVIPLFKEQIARGGPITVTDKKIIRYFMTIPEAVELVIQAGAMSKGGDVFLLDMGKPISIDDLARKMIRLSGLEVKDKDFPDGDIEIKYIGLRPGEKLYEELLVGSNVKNTENPYIIRAKEEMLLWDELKPILDNLKKVTQDNDQIKVRKLLVKLVPNFKPQNNITDPLYKKS